MGEQPEGRAARSTPPGATSGLPRRSPAERAASAAPPPLNCYASGVGPYGVYDMCGNTWDWCPTESEPGRSRAPSCAVRPPRSTTPQQTCSTTTPAFAA
ncbi:SUMF1/EgtB/PvdO family nonheme iron enzyme [Actinomadura terrae]|uniref:SUMF1/EgtB/PvdO family nonheme iron enzyme n=1 Tax=Actinomadura terrae TaxID=604353 RepID=UPI003556058D